MTNSVQILVAEMDGKDGVFVTFSDGTKAGYVVEELLELRPKREPTTPPVDDSDGDTTND
jgi:hypothetical protein